MLFMCICRTLYWLSDYAVYPSRYRHHREEENQRKTVCTRCPMFNSPSRIILLYVLSRDLFLLPRILRAWMSGDNPC
jgi:hypothetical protein